MYAVSVVFPFVPHKKPAQKGAGRKAVQSSRGKRLLKRSRAKAATRPTTMQTIMVAGNRRFRKPENGTIMTVAAMTIPVMA